MVLPMIGIKLCKKCKSGEISACNLFHDILLHEDNWDGAYIILKVIKILIKY